MGNKFKTTQDERILAAVAHGSILLGMFTNGIGGIATTLVIWLTQKEKSAYVAAQALQALVFQAITFVIAMIFFMCWGFLWVGTLFLPLITNPAAYDSAPPPGMFFSLALLIVPFAFGLVTLLYGLLGAFKSFKGHDFKYIAVGNWLENRG